MEIDFTGITKEPVFGRTPLRRFHVSDILENRRYDASPNESAQSVAACIIMSTSSKVTVPPPHKPFATPQKLITPAAACRIMKASMEPTLPSRFTSATSSNGIYRRKHAITIEIAAHAIIPD